jgi:HlyD family secretion protein
MAITRTSFRRLLAWTIGVVLLGVLIVMVFRPRPAAVDVARAARGDLQVTVDREGKTRVHDRYMVSAPVAGRVRRIELEPGDPVIAGRTIIATFSPGTPPLLDVRTRAEANARVRAAEAGVRQARATLAQATAERQQADRQRSRLTDLFHQNVTSRAELDQAEADALVRDQAAEAAVAGLSVAEHERDAAGATLLQASAAGSTTRRELVIRSPIDGVVLQRLHESEADVPSGEPLVEIGNPVDLEVVADYLSTDAVKIHPGMPALIDRWGGDRPLHARVRRVEPYGFLKVSALGVEEQRVNVVLGIDDAAAWRSLGDGYRVEVRVVLWEQSGVLKVPTSALFRRGADWAVFVAQNGRARVRTVSVGQRNGIEAQVLGGLADGEAVIVHPSDSVADGGRVTTRTS